MAEEIVREMRNLWEVYETIQQIYPNPDALGRCSLPGNNAFLTQEGDEMEMRRYHIVDADGMEPNGRSSWCPTPA